MTLENGGPRSPRRGYRREGEPTLVIATILREEGVTGVHTHVREFRSYLEECDVAADLVTPFSWGGFLSLPVFGLRPVLEGLSRAASVAWYRHWHELFLQNALRQHLANLGPTTMYAQGPEAARACLTARQGPHQRVVMAVHYEISQADGWVEKGYLRRGGEVYSAIRRMEKEVIPRLDALVYVSQHAQDALLSWLPEAAGVPSIIIPNFVRRIDAPRAPRPLGDLVTVGALEPNKKHQYLLEVLAEAKSAGHSLTLDLFGAGPLRQSLERSAQSLGLEDQVRFRGFHAAVREFLPGYRAYVHACPTETGPLAIIEAMAAGLPILAPKLGGPPELYSEGVEGRFWPLDDARRAAGILLDVIAPEATRRKFAASSLERFGQRFETERVCPQLLSFVLTGDASASAEDGPVTPNGSQPAFGVVGPATERGARFGAPRGADQGLPGASLTRRLLLDGMAIRRGGRGVARVLKHVLPLLVEECTDFDCVIITSAEGSELLGPCKGRVVVVPWMPKTLWEQFGLPWYARKLGASVIYSHSECGPTWGPPVLLHVPEDPYIRWEGAPARGYREHVRRLYQRSIMGAGLRHASILATSSHAIAVALRARFGDAVKKVSVVPLGVDFALFYPDRSSLSDEYVFHLGSDEPRDQSVVVVNSYARALEATPELPDLVIAGNLAGRSKLVRDAADEIGVGNRVHLLGRISDDELRHRYAHAGLCVQPAEYEGFGLQPLEALACGAPLIVFAEPAVEEVVGDAAIVVCERTEVALGDAMVRLWADRELRDSLRYAGPKRAQEFPWAATALKLHQLLSPPLEGYSAFSPTTVSSVTATKPSV